MRKELSERNDRENQNKQNDIYTVEEIAKKIFDDGYFENGEYKLTDPDLFDSYLEDLKYGVPQICVKPEEWSCIRLTEYKRSVKRKVAQGDKIATLEGSGDKVIKVLYATIDGIFFSNGDFFNENGLFFWKGNNEDTFEIGRIKLPEYDFYKKNQREIEIVVKQLVEKEQKAIKIEEQSKRDEEQRKNEKLLTDQRKSIENLDNLLKELDIYIGKKELPAIQTLKVINDQLKILYAQKENLDDIKSIKDFKSHFENAYKEAKKNLNFTDIIEQRMLDILRTIFEILGETKDIINAKISEIKSAGNDKKFAVEFNEKLNALNESITKLQSTFTNEKKLDFVQLETIEKISIDFEGQKKRINHKKLLERSKDNVESIWNEYSKMDEKSSSGEATLKRILKNFYAIFDKSEQEIIEIFSRIEEERDFANKLSEQNETIKSLSEKIRELEVIVENNEPVKIELLQTLEVSIKELVKQKDIIQDITEIENIKVHFDAISKDCKKRKDFSNSASLRMKEIEKGFEVICRKTKKVLFSKVLK